MYLLLVLLMFLYCFTGVAFRDLPVCLQNLVFNYLVFNYCWLLNKSRECICWAENVYFDEEILFTQLGFHFKLLKSLTQDIPAFFSQMTWCMCLWTFLSNVWWLASYFCKHAKRVIDEQWCQIFAPSCLKSLSSTSASDKMWIVPRTNFDCG